jgi:hypothetical protein
MIESCENRIWPIHPYFGDLFTSCVVAAIRSNSSS